MTAKRRSRLDRAPAVDHAAALARGRVPDLERVLVAPPQNSSESEARRSVPVTLAPAPVRLDAAAPVRLDAAALVRVSGRMLSK